MDIMIRLIHLLTCICVAVCGCAAKSSNLRTAVNQDSSSWSALENGTDQIQTSNEDQSGFGSSAIASVAFLDEELPRQDLVENDLCISELRTPLAEQAETLLDSDADLPAEDTSTGYTLAEIEGLALANNPTLAAAQALVSKSSGLRYQVGRYPNPLLGYFGQQIADRNTDQHGVFVEQEFVRGKKLELNQEALGHTQSAQIAAIDTQRFRILTDVRVRFFEAMVAQQRLDAIREFRQVAVEGVRVAEQRQLAEEGTLVETLQAKTLLSEISLAEEQASVELTGAWQDLVAIAGMDTASPTRLNADMSVPDRDTDWALAYAEIVAQSPELAVARAIVCEKLALYRRQQAQPIPNITTSLGAGYDDGTEHGMINALVSAPIPVWNQNRGNVKAAFAEYVRATQDVQRIERSIRSRLARTSAEFESSLRAVQKYEGEIIPQAAKSLELSESAYRVGELGFLNVLVVRRSYVESKLRLLDAKGRLAQAGAKVDGLLLSGGLESPPDFTVGVGIRDAALNGK